MGRPKTNLKFSTDPYHKKYGLRNMGPRVGLPAFPQGGAFDPWVGVGGKPTRKHACAGGSRSGHVRRRIYPHLTKCHVAFYYAGTGTVFARKGLIFNEKIYNFNDFKNLKKYMKILKKHDDGRWGGDSIFL